MINDVDTALADLLKQEMPIASNEVEIEFHQPKREWASRLNRPTLNIFLHEVHENTNLRQQEFQTMRNRDFTTIKKHASSRIDLHFMITAWASEPDDEHRLLTRALLALLRHPELPNPIFPDDKLPEPLREQPFPMMLRVAEPDALRNAADIWGVLDNEIRPAITCVVTVAFDPHAPITGPAIRERKLDIGVAMPPSTIGDPLPGGLEMRETINPAWAVGGMLNTKLPLDTLKLRLASSLIKITDKDGKEKTVDRVHDQRVWIDPDGRFVVGNLEMGEYTFEVSAADHKTTQAKLMVPSPSYDIEY